MPNQKSTNISFIKSKDEGFNMPSVTTQESLQILAAKNGQTTARYTKSTRPVFLHSFYNPGEEAKNMVKKFTNTKVKVLIVFGLGLGYHLEEILNVIPSVSSVIIVESDAEIFEQALETLDFEQLIGRRDLSVIVGSDPVEFRTRIKQAWDEFGDSEFLLFEHLPLKKLFLDFYSQAREIFISLQAGDKKDWDNLYKQRKLQQENIILNARNMCQAADISVINKKFEGLTAFIINTDKIDAKTAQLLEEFRSKALIFCTQEALGALYAQHIVPHLIFASSTNKIKTDKQIASGLEEKSALVFSAAAHPENIKMFNTLPMFVLAPRHNTFEWLQKQSQREHEYEGAQSALANMFDILCRMQIKSCVFVSDAQKADTQEIKKIVLESKIRTYQLSIATPHPLPDIDISTAEEVKIHIQAEAFDFERTLAAASKADLNRDCQNKLIPAMESQLEKLKKFSAVLSRAAEFYNQMAAGIDEKGRDFLEECHVQGVHMERMKFEILSSPELLDFIEPSMRPSVLVQARGTENIKAITDDLARVKEIVKNDMLLYSEMDSAAKSVISTIKKAVK